MSKTARWRINRLLSKSGSHSTTTISAEGISAKECSVHCQYRTREPMHNSRAPKTGTTGEA
jgi:hypothetical protein